MERIVVHIGLHKSASTYLQTNVFSKIPANYIFISGFKREFLDLVQSKKGFESEKFKNWIAEEIKRKYSDKKFDLTILSHEELSGHPHGYLTINPETVALNLKNTFSKAKIILVLRNQFDYLKSIYCYRVAIKGSESRSFNKFLDEESNLGLFEKLEYHKLVEIYYSLFGRENVLVIPFELLKKDSYNFHKRLFKFLNVPETKLSNNNIVNESTKLSFVLNFWRPFNYLMNCFLGFLKFLHIETNEEYPYMKIRYSYYNFKQKLTGFLNKTFKSNKKINIETYKKYNELYFKYSKSNHLLENITGLNLSELGYPKNSE